MSNNLYKKIRRYSMLKTIGVIPFSIVAIVSIIFFGILAFFQDLNNFFRMMKLISAVLMMIGIFVPMITIYISEKMRNKLINLDSDVMIQYLDLFKSGIIKNNFIYYDAVELFLINVRRAYLYGNFKNKKYIEIINSLNYILLEDYRNGLANPFIYKRRDDFKKICDYVIDYYENNVIHSEGHIYNYYQNLKKEEYVKSNPLVLVIRKFIFKIAKIVLLLLCCIFFFIPSINSIVFNLTTIILLGLDIMQSSEKDISINLNK